MFAPTAGQPNPDPESAAPAKPVSPAPKAAPEAASLRAGARLKAAREARGLSLEQVAAKLTLRPDYVAALETMAVNLIPGKAYAKAYLRSYIRYLELDEDALVRQYESESARLREDAAEQIRNPVSKPGRERPWVWALLLAVVGAGFIGLRAYNDRTREEAAAPPPVVQAAPAAPSPQRPAPAQADSADLDPFALAAQMVEIEATTAGWIEVRGPDGTIFMSRTLQPGEKYRPDVGAGWTIHARDGGAFKIKLNGAEVGPLGDPGAPVLGRPVDKIAAAAVGES